MDDLTSLIDLIAQATGVKASYFVLVSFLVALVVAAVRSGAFITVSGRQLKNLPCWKLVLTVAALGLGIGGAFLAWAAKIYGCPNAAAVVFVGLCNGAIAIVGWQLLKKIPGADKLIALVENLLAGNGTKTLPPPPPSVPKP